MIVIAAVDRNWGIGKENKLLFSVPADMKFFKETTTGNTVVMGSKTFFSLPGAAPLKNRVNIVLSRDPGLRIDGAVVVDSVESLFSELEKRPASGVFVIGGESVYKLLLPYCSAALITKIDAEAESPDAFFENLDENKAWRAVSVSEEAVSNGYKLRFWRYERTEGERNAAPK